MDAAGMAPTMMPPGCASEFPLSWSWVSSVGANRHEGQALVAALVPIALQMHDWGGEI